MEFVKITPDIQEAALQLLRDTFFVDEPLSKALQFSDKRGDKHEALEQYCLATIACGYSFAAVENNKILGVALNGIIKPGDIERSIEKLKYCPDEKFKKVFTFLYNSTRELDLFSKYNVDIIFENRICSVSELARGRGLGKTLLQRSVDMGRQHGFKLMKADATNAFSQKMCTSVGMTLLRTLPYDEYCDPSGAPVFNVPPPHKALLIYVIEYK